MLDLCLVINTCKEYYKNIDILINQINTIDKKNIFPRENILIVSGQEHEDSVTNKEGITIAKVTYTGLHLTSLIYIYENIDNLKSRFNYYLVLPDTIKFGKKFFDIIVSLYDSYIKHTNVLSLPLIDWRVRPTMDMGMLHHHHIINIREYLNKMKLCKPYDITMLKKLKKQLIYNENMVLGLPSYFSKDKYTQFDYVFSFNPSKSISPIIKKKEDVIETIIKENGKKINQVYLKPLDLYKFQRNFSLEGEVVLEL